MTTRCEEVWSFKKLWLCSADLIQALNLLGPVVVTKARASMRVKECLKPSDTGRRAPRVFHEPTSGPDSERGLDGRQRLPSFLTMIQDCVTARCFSVVQALCGGPFYIRQDMMVIGFVRADRISISPGLMGIGPSPLSSLTAIISEAQPRVWTRH